MFLGGRPKARHLTKRHTARPPNHMGTAEYTAEWVAPKNTCFLLWNLHHQKTSKDYRFSAFPCPFTLGSQSKLWGPKIDQCLDNPANVRPCDNTTSCLVTRDLCRVPPDLISPKEMASELQITRSLECTSPTNIMSKLQTSHALVISCDLPFLRHCVERWWVRTVLPTTAGSAKDWGLGIRTYKAFILFAFSSAATLFRAFQRDCPIRQCICSCAIVLIKHCLPLY